MILAMVACHLHCIDGNKRHGATPGSLQWQGKSIAGALLPSRRLYLFHEIPNRVGCYPVSLHGPAYG